jgi:hypothetical protein
MLGVNGAFRWAGEMTGMNCQSKSEALTCLKHGSKFLATHFNANMAWLLENGLHLRRHFEPAVTWHVMVYEVGAGENIGRDLPRGVFSPCAMSTSCISVVKSSCKGPTL